jgi:ABC-2 type transport system ATP-binding protein
MNTVIEVQNLRKAYQQKFAAPGTNNRELIAVYDVSFQVEQGEIFGILGPNGAGKTTTLEIIEGLKQQSTGTVTVLGLDNLKNTNTIKHKIGVQLQSSQYIPHLTLGELLKLFAALYNQTVDVHELLTRVNLADKANSFVADLSGGQKQRFSIASTLVNKPAIIFLDEPTTGLDPRARRDLWELIKTINAAGTTIVLTTHYMEEAEYLCHRVAIMDAGRVLTVADPAQLINDVAHTTQVSFLTKAAVANEVLAVLPGVTKVYQSFPKITLELNSLDSVSELVKQLQHLKIPFSGFALRTASLEDVYLDLTGKNYHDV